MASRVDTLTSRYELGVDTLAVGTALEVAASLVHVDGDIVVLGDSILFHAIDGARATELAGGKLRIVNHALNGAAFQHESQMLEEYLARQQTPAWVVLEMPSAQPGDGRATSPRVVILRAIGLGFPRIARVERGRL